VGKTGVLGIRERDGYVRAVVLEGTTSEEIVNHIFVMESPIPNDRRAK
jgi:hypothetical protein